MCLLYAMSDCEGDRLLKEMSDLVDDAEHQAHLQNLEQLMHQQAEPSTSQSSTRQPSNINRDVGWIKRDSDGNIIYSRPRSSRKQAGQIFFFYIHVNYNVVHHIGMVYITTCAKVMGLNWNVPYLRLLIHTCA